LTCRVNRISPVASVRKKFNRDLYNKTNNKAIQKGVAYLKSQGHKILDKTETYGPDIVSEKAGKLYYTEVETKLVWSGDWPESWKDVRLPERKKRLIELAKNNKASLSFIIFNKEYKQAWKIPADVVDSSPLEEISNRYVSKGEYFFVIPLKKAKLLKIK